MKQLLIAVFGGLVLFSVYGCSSGNTVKPEEVQKLQDRNKTMQEQLKSKDDQIEALNDKLVSLSAEATNTVLQREEQVKAFSNLVMSLQSEISASNASVKMVDNAVNITLLDKIFFDEGSADIKTAGKSSLDKLVPVLKKVKGQIIRVEGYTDDVPIADSLKWKYPSNWELSTDRAAAVVRFLREKGVNPDIMKATGYGRFNPVASNGNDEDRAKNRRIVVVLVPMDNRAKFK